MISTLVSFAADGIPHSAGQRPLTLLVISCFAAWRTGFRPTVLGTWTGRSQRLLDRSGSPEKAGRNAVDLSRQTTELRPGTILGREWNGQMQQVAVLASISCKKCPVLLSFFSVDDTVCEQEPLPRAYISASVRSRAKGAGDKVEAALPARQHAGKAPSVDERLGSFLHVAPLIAADFTAPQLASRNFI